MHKLRLQHSQVLAANQEATAAFDREAARLDAEILLRKSDEDKAKKELQQLEKEISGQMLNISRLEREQRHLRQELRDI